MCRMQTFTSICVLTVLRTSISCFVTKIEQEESNWNIEKIEQDEL